MANVFHVHFPRATCNVELLPWVNNMTYILRLVEIRIFYLFGVTLRALPTHHNADLVVPADNKNLSCHHDCLETCTRVKKEKTKGNSFPPKEKRTRYYLIRKKERMKRKARRAHEGKHGRSFG